MSIPLCDAQTRLPRLLVLASTYPRWADDPEPGFVHELCKRLTEHFTVTVLCPHAQGALTKEVLDGVIVVRYRYAPAVFERLVNDGGIVTNLRRSPWMAALVPYFMLGQFFTLIRLLHQQRPSTIHAHWIVPQGLTAAVALGLLRYRPRFVVTSHGADLFALRGKLMTRVKRFVLQRATRISVVSSIMRKEISNLGIDKAQVDIEPMGTELTHLFTPDYGLSRQANELLFVGRMVEKKGLSNLIQALPTVLQRHPDTVLNIVGFGPEEATCKALVYDLGLMDKVRFLGALPQSSLPAFYRRASALVAPFMVANSGDQEGLGLVMVEAIGCLCPVITTHVPAVQEVFGGSWPRYAAIPNSPSSLAEQIVRLLNEPLVASEWVSQLRQDVLRRFDYAAVASRYAAILMPPPDLPNEPTL